MKKRVGVIGCGMRVTAYFKNIPAEFRASIQIVAVADPDAANRRFFLEQFAGGHAVSEHADWRDLLRGAEIDALIITSPNHVHAEQLIAALRLGVPILLEKPVAISLEQCRAIWQAYLSSSRPPIVIGFVLRFVPFFRRLLEKVSSGEMGQLLQVDADELLNAGMTSVFFRQGWKLHDQFTGGLLVEKCCHDFDVLSLLAGSAPRQVFSLAARTHFIPRPRQEQHPRFDAENTRKMGLDYGDLHVKRYFESISSESVYARGEVPDHQAVMIEFENGVLSNFSVCFGQPRSTRRIRLYASNGSLDADICENRIAQLSPHEADEKWDEHSETISHDATGHHGGDGPINLMFWRIIFGAASDPHCPGLREGLDAAITAICAMQSARTGLPVNVADARASVYQETSPLASSASEMLVEASS